MLSCLHMMGLCALELGRAADAVAHLEQALSLPDLPSDQRVPLRYDLARAYAAQGDVARARSAFEEVRAADPGFGDVAARAGRPRERAAERRLAPAADEREAYESFDDLLSESADARAGTALRVVRRPVRRERPDDARARLEPRAARARGRAAARTRAGPASSPRRDAAPEPRSPRPRRAR